MIMPTSVQAVDAVADVKLPENLGFKYTYINAYAYICNIYIHIYNIQGT